MRKREGITGLLWHAFNSKAVVKFPSWEFILRIHPSDLMLVLRSNKYFYASNTFPTLNPDTGVGWWSNTDVDEAVILAPSCHFHVKEVRFQDSSRSRRVNLSGPLHRPLTSSASTRDPHCACNLSNRRAHPSLHKQLYPHLKHNENTIGCDTPESCLFQRLWSFPKWPFTAWTWADSLGPDMIQYVFLSSSC